MTAWSVFCPPHPLAFTPAECDTMQRILASAPFAPWEHALDFVHIAPYWPAARLHSAGSFAIPNQHLAPPREPLVAFRYRTGASLAAHTDDDSGRFQRTVGAAIVQLSAHDDYIGGLLQSERESAPTARGTVIVIPLGIEHWVTELTAGTRYSLSLFLSRM